jgi:hypothetical protein
MALNLCYHIAYPEELIGCSSKKALLYAELRDIAMEYSSQVSSENSKKLLLSYPEIKNKIDPKQFQGFIAEIVKNIFDSVNNAKVNNLDISGIEIKISVNIVNNKLLIKIGDNGSGFEQLKKSKKVALSDYLYSRNGNYFFGFLRSKMPVESITSKIEFEKQLGKNYLLGGQGIGLAAMDKIVKASQGSIRVKNRKRQGASIEIELPYHSKNTQVANEIIKEKENGMDEILEEMELREPLMRNKVRYHGTF